MTRQLGESGKEILQLWKEFEFGDTPEARFANEVDKLEMVFQAFGYETDVESTRLRGRVSTRTSTCSTIMLTRIPRGGQERGPQKLTDMVMAVRTRLGFDRQDRYSDLPAPCDSKDK